MADVLVEGASVNRLEPVHQVVAAEEEGPGQALDGQLLPQVVPDVAGDLLHLGVKAVGYVVRLGLQQVPVQGDEQLENAGVGEEPGGKAAVPVLQMHNSFPDFLSTSLIPELSTDIAACPSCNIHFTLVLIAAGRAFLNTSPNIICVLENPLAFAYST